MTVPTCLILLFRAGIGSARLSRCSAMTPLSMGNLSRFRWLRALPETFPNWSPGFVYDQFVPVRQLQTIAHTVTTGGASTLIAEVFIPSNSWAIGKVMTMRFAVEIDTFGGPLPVLAPVPIQFQMTGGLVLTESGPTTYTPVAGVFSTVIEWRFWFDGSNIYRWNQGDTTPLWSPNHNDNTRHFGVVYSVPTDVDLTASVTLSIFVTPLPAPVAMTITTKFVQAFLEQAVNLGAAVY